MLLVVFVPLNALSFAVVGSTLPLLLVLGSVAAGLGGAPRVRGAFRVAFWGAIAMGVTTLVGRIFAAVAP